MGLVRFARLTDIPSSPSLQNKDPGAELDPHLGGGDG